MSKLEEIVERMAELETELSNVHKFWQEDTDRLCRRNAEIRRLREQLISTDHFLRAWKPNKESPMKRSCEKEIEGIRKALQESDGEG